MTLDVPRTRPGSVPVEPRRPAMTLRDRYTDTDGRVQLTGVQALVRLPLDQRRADAAAGLRTGGYVSGYEGSPLAGYDLELLRNRELLDAHGVVVAPGLNEELALTAVQGTQLAPATGALRDDVADGITGYWYGKAPGLDRATDALRHANLAGTSAHGGALAIVGDDPAAKSSSVPCASEAALADMAVPVLYPADVADVLDLGRHAVHLSRISGCWVGLKMVTAVADGSGTVAVGPDRIQPVVPDLEIDGTPFRHEPHATLLGPRLAPLERDLHRARLVLARRYAAANRLDTIVGRGPARVGIVAAGKSWLDLRQALAALGLDDDECARRGVRLLRVGMPWPLEPGVVDHFADGLDEIVVVEEKRAFLETQIKERLYGRPGAPAVHGKRDDAGVLFAEHGDLDPDAVAVGLARRLLAHGDVPSVQAWDARRRSRRTRIDLPIAGANRQPFYCSGCPHNTSTTSAPEGSLVGAGIGCHTMVMLMPESQVGGVTGLTQMGGEGAHWLGTEPFADPAKASHWVQNMGDGTFHHSGSLAIRAAVAAGAHMTFRLLHNGAAAMTGGQDAVGALPMPALVRVLLDEGVARVIVTTEDTARYRRVRLAKGVVVWDRSRIDEAQELLAATPGVTVLVHDQECAAQKRRKRKRGTLPDPTTRVVINERVCEGCGDCGQTSNCLSVTPVDTEFGRKTRIHQASCNKDYSCLDGDCPAFTVVEPGAARSTVAVPPLDAASLPTPVRTVRDEAVIRLAGIGGTGVTTTSQVLAAAARIDGRPTRGLDQTGLAQKGGAVVSDVKLGDAEVAGRAAAGEADLYLGADLLVAADPVYLAAASPQRTVAVVSSAKIPTGEQVVDPSVSYPPVDAVLGRIRSAVRADVGAVLDARALSETLFGDDQFSLSLLVGAAFQLGALPLSAAAVEAAFELNGAAVERNVQAFRRGRQSVADPAAFAALVEEVTRPAPSGVPGLTTAGAAAAAEIVASIGAPAGSELARLVGIRVPELVAYQDAAYARSYAAVVGGLVDGPAALAEAVAVGLHKLMAYKDEYEVARLSTDPAFSAGVRAEFGADARISWKLHPPSLRAMGLRHKLTLGPWFRPAYSTLRAMRRLRGTPLDPFGRAEVRRVERALVEEYRALVPRLSAMAADGEVERAVRIAALPDMVRGYEGVKLANVARYREALRAM
ncbi:indolepyruvate ferredoxin oxidoreductase family protein [Actinomycetospora sp. TBRC 11914]|uniref:indolepyruvate ferredoxin oxidoreductase family protein n=1 Tax=Actinomycetospora sp. TBRC 11914 TaxID=2729387 RepID=UPI00145E9AD3|nr:indolepyruvate ferredoxin oxidoreductase family protein [Actinomycetospora sp. TBRC 11914]NMO93610.1 indolepyruvate ferredoxin oxidoreductase family protein [Actinomycetospora sp. TBRC 11914]